MGGHTGRVEFGILGPVEARRGDRSPFPVGGPQVRALLAALALDAGRVVGRERLIDELYGEEPPGDAGHALQSQVSRLRRALRGGGETGEIVESTGAGYRLAVDADAVDATRFARLAEAGRKALRDSDPGAALTLLDEALGLWRGTALADVRDAPFAEAQAARLDERRLAAEEDRAEAALAVGEPDAALPALSELVAAHPLRERGRALLMRGLYAAGRQAEALESFEQGRRLLADELGADPSAELMDAHLAILRADEVAAVSNRRLPTPLTSLVGRDDDLARLMPLLASSRLVTLLGPGGTGKTRLALAAGARVRGEVYFVDLSPLVDGAQIAQAVEATLGGRDGSADMNPAAAHANRDPVERLTTMLTDRALVLILDNCEQVVLDAARLANHLLRACPGLRILATSREALRITGETVFPVPQLPIAASDAPLTDQLTSPAVRLFAERAAAVRPDFTVDAGIIAMVSRICARLDGLPLAIELAAARLRTLDLPEIDARLDDRFRLLARGDRTAEPRHQTLQAVVAWSWDLLTPAEQLLAQRFSVFASGATVEHVRRVCAAAVAAAAQAPPVGAQPLPPAAEPPAGFAGPHAGVAGLPADVAEPLDDIDDLLADLVDKSLLRVDSGRYRMLETIREFAARRLAESGAHAATHRAHAEYFTILAEAAEPLLRTRTQLDHLARLAADHDNLQSALRWSATADPALAARLIAAQSWYWWLTGRPGEASALANHILPELNSKIAGIGPAQVAGVDRSGATGGERGASKALASEPGGASGKGLAPANHILSELDSMIPRVDPVQVAGVDRVTATGRERSVGGPRPTAADLEGATGWGARTIAEAAGRWQGGEAWAAPDVEHYALCVAVAARGRSDLGAELERAAAGVAGLDRPLRQPYTVLLLAVAGVMVPGDPAVLRRLFGDDAWSQAFLRLGDGIGMFMSGHVDESEAEFAAALAGFRGIGDRWAIATSLDKLAAVAERRGDLVASLKLIDEAIAVNTELGWVADTSDLLTRRGDIRLGEGAGRDVEAARADYQRAAELARTHGAVDMYANALRGLGDVARVEDSARARVYYAAVLEIPAGGSPTLLEAHERAHRGLALLDGV